MNPQPLGAEALELDVRDVMTAGVITVDDDATVEEAVEAMAANRIHAVLVVGARSGTALGWVTTRGVLAHIGGAAATRVTDAITEDVRTIDPSANVRAAIYAVTFPGTTRLLVQRRGQAREGVVTDYDLTGRAIAFSRRRASPQAAA